MRRTTVIAAVLILVLAATSMTVVFAQAKKKTEQARDPVCGIMVDKDANLSASYRGETYYFCSKADMEKFRKEPERYVRKR